MYHVHIISIDSVALLCLFSEIHSKCFWADSVGMVGATGFSSGASRQMKLWDLRGDVQKPIYNQNIDDGSSVLMPHMDNDLSMLYLAGKGDSTLSYYELKNDDKIVYYLSSFRDKVAQKGGGWVPKRGLAQMKCEVQKFLKLTNDAVVPISFIVCYLFCYVLFHVTFLVDFAFVTFRILTLFVLYRFLVNRVVTCSKMTCIQSVHPPDQR